MLNNDRLLVQILLLVLFGASLWVMAPFWSALFWGAVLAFASWPLMRLLTRVLGGRESLAASILTLGWMLLVAGPLYVLYELGVILSRVFRIRPPEELESPALPS